MPTASPAPSVTATVAVVPIAGKDAECTLHEPPEETTGGAYDGVGGATGAAVCGSAA